LSTIGEDSVQVVGGSRESNLKIPGIGAEYWLLKPMVKHLVAHAGEATAALLNPVEIGQALRTNRIPPAGTIVSLAGSPE
jgi:hypothetical protein